MTAMTTDRLAAIELLAAEDSHGVHSDDVIALVAAVRDRNTEIARYRVALRGVVDIAGHRIGCRERFTHEDGDCDCPRGDAVALLEESE